MHSVAFMYRSFTGRQLLLGAALCAALLPAAAQTRSPHGVVGTVPQMPPVPDPTNLYSESGADRLSPEVARHLARVYVPSRTSNVVSVIDPESMKLVDTLRLPARPRFVVPAWDLKKLWVVSHTEGRPEGSLTALDPASGKLGASVAVTAPHNLYWSPDGRHAIVVVRAHKRLELREATAMGLVHAIPMPDCDGLSHAEVSISGRFAAFTCEDGGAVSKVDLVNRRVVDTIKVSRLFQQARTEAADGKTGTSVAAGEMSMPQDMRISPDGRRLYVSDLIAGGVHVLDFADFRQVGFIPTGEGAHGLYPSRDGKSLYVANRGAAHAGGTKRVGGSVSVIDFEKGKVRATWPVPGGGSPDMGTVSADGKYLWLSGRHDAEVYRFDTGSGEVTTVPLAHEAHGLLVWPQPGRYSLGYTGLLR